MQQVDINIFLFSDTLSSIAIAEKNSHFEISSGTQQKSHSLDLHQLGWGLCSFPYPSFKYGKRNVGTKDITCAASAFPNKSYLDIHIRISPQHKSRMDEGGLFQVSLDRRASEEWIYVVNLIHTEINQSQQNDQIMKGLTISIPAETEFMEVYPDDMVLSYPSANVSGNVRSLKLSVRMEFHEKKAIERCTMHGNDTMFKFCYHYLPGGYYHHFEETFHFTDPHKQHAMSLPLTDKKSVIQPVPARNYGDNVLVKSVQLFSHSLVHLYMDGFTNERTNCRKHFHCYNYSSHYARLKLMKHGYYFAFYHHKIKHMSLLYSSELYNLESLYKKQPNTDRAIMRFSDQFWTLDPEYQKELLLSVSRVTLSRGQWNGNWMEACRLCKSVSGSLPVLTSKREQDEVLALLKFSYGIHPPYPLIYIGLFRQKV